MHGKSHEDIVLLGVQSLILLSLIRVKQRVMGWASSVFANVCAAYVSM